MQTLRDALPLGARSLAIAAACAMLMPLTGCSAPNLEAQVNEAAKPDTCESSYESAVGESGTMAAGHPLMMRYLSATAAASSWAEVASSCPARAVEGAVHSAQSSYTAQVLAARLGITASSAPTMDYGSLVRLSMDTDALSKIVLEEDRAGFSLGVLAARGVAGATLSASDAHKTAAQRLFSLSGSSTDPRQKVYEVDHLIASPNTIDDPANKIETSTVAAIEMNCARSYLEALSGSKHTSRATLAWLADAATAHVWHAFELGYPLFDAALLEQDAD